MSTQSRHERTEETRTLIIILAGIILSFVVAALLAISALSFIWNNLLLISSLSGGGFALLVIALYALNWHAEAKRQDSTRGKEPVGELDRAVEDTEDTQRRHREKGGGMDQQVSNGGDGPNSPTAQGEVTPDAIRDLSTEDKREVARVAVRDLPTEDKKDVANQVLQALPTGATAVKKDLAKDALESLSAQDQLDVAGSLLQGPTQAVTNRIWLIVIWAFSIVFVLAALMLFVSVLLGLENTQIVLTVFTTVTGVLAGFISGRASTRGT